MQKFGIKKYKDEKIHYYKKDIKNIQLSDINLKISKISSCIINYEIIDIEFINSSNTVRINIKYNINILYITQESSDLLSYEKEVPVVEYLSIPKILHGVMAKDIFMKNKFEIEIYIENISCIDIKEDTIIISYMYICVLNIVKDFSVSYIMDNTLYENIYSSYYDGENLTQNTNMIDMKISKLGHQIGTKNIVFVGAVEENIDVYIYMCKKEVHSLRNIIGVENVNDYIFINKNNLILCCDTDYQTNIYTLNIITNKSNRLNIDIKFGQIKNLKYSNLNKNIYFISNINDKDCLCKFDLNSNTDVLFNHYDVEDYIIIDSIQKCILKIKKDKFDKIFLLDLSNNILSPIIFNFEYINIQSFSYLKNKKNDYSILFLLNCENEMILVEYKLNNFQTNIVYSHKLIRCFNTSNNSKDIFIAVKNNTFYEVIKINNSNTESILRTQSEIKEICLHGND